MLNIYIYIIPTVDYLRMLNTYIYIYICIQHFKIINSRNYIYIYILFLSTVDYLNKMLNVTNTARNVVPSCIRCGWISTSH